MLKKSNQPNSYVDSIMGIQKTYRFVAWQNVYIRILVSDRIGVSALWNFSDQPIQRSCLGTLSGFHEETTEKSSKTRNSTVKMAEEPPLLSASILITKDYMIKTWPRPKMALLGT